MNESETLRADAARRARAIANSLIGLYGITSADAEDFYSDVLQVIDHAAYDPAKGNYHAFVNTILQHKRIDILRKFRRAEQRIRKFGASQLVHAEPVPHAFDLLALHLAIRKLNARDQRIVHLYYWADLNASEVARVLNVSHTTINRRLRVIPTLLRRILAVNTYEVSNERSAHEQH